MADIIVRRFTAGEAEADAGSRRKMFIATEDRGLFITVPFAPKEITYENRARLWSQIDRPGLSPILADGGLPLPTQGFELILASTDPDADVEEECATLEALAQSPERVIVNFGPAEAGLWRISAFSYKSVDRHAESQAIKWATATIEFTRASDYAARTGPVTGGAVPSSGSGTKPPAKSAYYGGGTYTVKKNDTLGKISNRFYKTPSRWRLIADANKIKKPKRTKKLAAGRRLKIPKVRKK